MLCCRAVPASPQRPDCRFTQLSPYLTQRFRIDAELVLTASPKSPPDTPSAAAAAAAAGREDQSDFGTANPNSAMKAAASSASASAASLANDGEGVSKATSMTRLSSTTSLAFGLGLGDSAGGSRRASSRELSQVDHFQVEELANAHAASRTPSEKSALSKAASLDGERRSLMGGSESEAANGNYGSMVDSGGDDEKSVSA